MNKKGIISLILFGLIILIFIDIIKSRRIIIGVNIKEPDNIIYFIVTGCYQTTAIENNYIFSIIALGEENVYLKKMKYKNREMS